MLIVTSRQEAASRSRQIQVHGATYTIDEYVGQAPKRGHYLPGNEVNDDGRPQGFLVHQPPGAVTPAHFHEPNQFQVFVGGNGRIGAATAEPWSVQYANGHTPYGPIVAGDKGVQYFTLRQRWDPGAKYLPASRDLLRSGNQRRRIKSGISVGDDQGRLARRATEVDVLIEREADGMAAWMWRLPARGSSQLPDPADGGGQYLIVAGGTLSDHDRPLGYLSAVFVSHDEAGFTLRAGPEGLDLLVLQYPRLGEALTGPARRA